MRHGSCSSNLVRRDDTHQTGLATAIFGFNEAPNSSHNCDAEKMLLLLSYFSLAFLWEKLCSSLFIHSWFWSATSSETLGLQGFFHSKKNQRWQIRLITLYPCLKIRIFRQLFLAWTWIGFCRIWHFANLSKNFQKVYKTKAKTDRYLESISLSNKWMNNSFWNRKKNKSWNCSGCYIDLFQALSAKNWRLNEKSLIQFSSILFCLKNCCFLHSAGNFNFVRQISAA